MSPPTSARALGRAWPLLSGEGGEYGRLARRDGARGHLRTIAEDRQRGADAPRAGLGRAARRPGGRGYEEGEGTRSATPPAWTHAQYVRLAWSIVAGKPIERPSIVACRYTGDAC